MILLLIVVLLVVFCGGGYYYGEGPRGGGIGLGTILLILLVWYLVRGGLR